MFKRFFAFGCSWTEFIWPTWADIVSWDLEIPYENWGMSGGCNQSIQIRLVECDFRNTFTPEDLIVINWTGFNRESRFKKTDWNTGGSVFNNLNYSKEWVNKYWDPDWDEMRNKSIIHLVGKAYGDLISYQSSIAEYEDGSDIAEFYSRHIKKIPLFQVNNSFYNGRCSDPHPDILAHLNYVETQLYPALNLGPVKQSTKDKCNMIFNRIAEVLDPNDDWNSMEQKTLSITRDFIKNKKYGF